MSAEGEAGPLCSQTEDDPPGGATVLTDSTVDRTSAPEEHPHPRKTRALTGHASDNSTDTSPREADGENDLPQDGGKHCPSREEESREKTEDSFCSSDSSILTPSCRICFQGAEQGELLNPCRCDGSVRHAHQHCLLKWISERGCWTCELCCYRFIITAMTIKRPWQWQAVTLTLVEKVQIVAVFLGSLFLLTSVSWLLWSALSPSALWQRRDLLFQICYGMYGFMDLVCIGLIVHEGGAVHSVLMRWRAVNLQWDLRSYDKSQDLEDPTLRKTLWLPLATLATPPAPAHTRLEPSPCCCPLSPPHPSDQDSGELVIRVTSV